MKKVLVMGGSGMLGAMVADYLARQGEYSLCATVRNPSFASNMKEFVPEVEWLVLDAEKSPEKEIVATQQGVDWVINCIGVIKPYVHDDNQFEIERAIRVNSLFPHLLRRAAETSGARIIQIATDCVFSGKRGDYIENDEHDPLDVYGKTKSLGEVHSKQFCHLRCSIIGPEPKAHLSLLDWFLGQPKDGQVNGFTNHYWNGVTTLAFAKICDGIITQSFDMPLVQHVIPLGKISKTDMLECFASYYNRRDIRITPTEAAVRIDRTLGTQNKDLNDKLWMAAGYDHLPTLPQMVEELAQWNYRIGEYFFSK